jgi:glycosyltransferase involved in cell wall biosynthesis
VNDKIKLFGLILTYNCEKFIEKAIEKIPREKFDKIICSDDGSEDKTEDLVKKNKIDFFKNQHSGYGGNLLNGLKIAFEMGATHVVEIHGDGQYELNNINDVIVLLNKRADLILGNRFFKLTEPLVHGMPFHIYIGNLFFSFIGRVGLGLMQRDLFPGFRVYSLNFFNIIKNYKLSKGYQFSFEIIALSKFYNLNIVSINVVCNYKGDRSTAPISYDFKALINIVLTILLYRLAKNSFLFSIFNSEKKNNSKF